LQRKNRKALKVESSNKTPMTTLRQAKTQHPIADAEYTAYVINGVDGYHQARCTGSLVSFS
jgi:hypothetical protein